MLKLWICAFLLLAAFLAVSCALGQTASTGSIRGVMTDDSGAIIPAAKVAISGNGVNRTVQTQSDGSYTVVGLPPGQ